MVRVAEDNLHKNPPALRQTTHPSPNRAKVAIAASVRVAVVMDLAHVTRIAGSLCGERAWGEPQLLGHGNSGAVFRITHPTHGEVALKIYDPTFFEGENAAIETRRVKLQEQLRTSDNEYVIETLEAEELPDSATWYMIMELCPWPTLDTQIADLPDDRVEPLLHQLVHAVIFLHEQNVIHRDIKPSNIAMAPDYSRLKLLDLGVLRRIDPLDGNGTDADATKKRFVATAQYSPPEYLTRQEPTGAQGYDALNVYQVGAVLHDMITKRQLFGEEAASRNRYILYEAVKGKRPIISNPSLSVRLISLCRAALEKDPHERLARVSLADMLVQSEDTNALRRRLAAARSAGTAAKTQVSVEIWKRRVWDWIADAANQERATLGRFRRIPVPTHNGAVEWKLHFPDCDRGLKCGLEPAQGGNGLTLTFTIETPTEVCNAVLDIYEDGPAIPEADVVDQLAQQILYMLSLMEQPADDGME